MSGTAPMPVMSPAPPALEAAVADLAEAEMRLAAEIAALRDVIASRWPDGDEPYHVLIAKTQVADAEHVVLEIGRQVRDASVLATFAEAEAVLLEAAPEPPRQHRRPARHRAGDRPLMRSVPTGDGTAPRAAIPLAAVAGLAYRAAAAHKAVAAVVTAVVLGAGAAGTAAVAAHAAHASASPAPARIAAAIPGWATSATPIAAAVAAPARRRRQDGADAGNAGRLRIPRPRVSPSPSPSPLPPQGTLSVPVSLAVGPAGTAVLVITAEGGPVSWTAEAGNPAVTLDGLASDSGTLADGQSAEIVVAVPIADLITPDSTTITLEPGGVQVLVSWV